MAENGNPAVIIVEDINHDGGQGFGQIKLLVDSSNDSSNDSSIDDTIVNKTVSMAVTVMYKDVTIGSVDNERPSSTFTYTFEFIDSQEKDLYKEAA